MPATEQTRYPIGRLHRVFAVSSLALLAATIWMLVVDHRRPWKQYQRTANEIQIRMAGLRESQFETDAAASQRDQLREQLRAVQAQGLDLNLIATLQTEVLAESQRRGEPVDMRDLPRRVERLEAAMRAFDGAGEGDEATVKEIQAARQAVLRSIGEIVAEAEFAETRQFDLQKSTTADLEVARANVNLAVRTGRDQTELKKLQAVADAMKEKFSSIALEHEQRKAHRERLEELLGRLTADERKIEDELASNRAELERLRDTVITRRSTWFNFDDGFPKPGKKLLELPILDAFNSPLRVHNLWAEGLTQDYNFREVPRFDRCTTCHTAMETNLPGLPAAPEYPHAKILQFALELGGKSTRGVGDEEDAADESVERIAGVRLADGGLLNDDDVSIAYVRPRSPAARAKLAVEASPLLSSDEIYRRLMWPSDDSRTTLSPQGLLAGDVIVAIDGQLVEGQPAIARRILEEASEAALGGAPEMLSVVLTVRRGVPRPYTSHPRLDLFVGESSPHKMSEFACTVCHDGQGSATDFTWASHSPNSEPQRKRWRAEYDWFDNPHWAYPMAPRRFVESNCLKCHHRVVDLMPSERFPDSPAPKLLRGYQLILADGCFGCHEINGYRNNRSIGPDLRLEATAQVLDAEAARANPEGQDGHARTDDTLRRLRRPGPSLRGVGRKLTPDFMADWIANPRTFSTTSRMPRAFGLWSHLEGASRQLAEQYEPVEISGIVAYLQSNTEPVPLLSAPSETAPSEAAEQIARGRELFQTRGCLACHNHKQFPDAAALRDEDEIVAGPDLSAAADKLVGTMARQWLYSFLRKPTNYDPRTIMPDLSLEPLVQSGEEGEEDATTDPVDDLVVFLLATSSEGYSAAPYPVPSGEILDRLVLEYLGDAYYDSKALEYAQRGIPPGIANSVRDAEQLLLVTQENAVDPEYRLGSEQKLRYVGYKSIAKYGCFGCHDIAGFENAKPIGPALTDWGRIDPHRLAFENIAQYLDRHTANDKSRSEQAGAGSVGSFAANGDGLSPFYRRQILSGKRSGFAYQKLREPRSYDYGVVDNKRYNERLRMHQFSFSDEDREAIVTFVLGLVAQPPTDKYVYNPDRRRSAVLDGQVVLDRYRCGSCHMLKPEQWQIALAPGTFQPPRDKPTFPFVPHRFSQSQLEASQQPNRGGLLNATLSGVPSLGPDGRPMVFDDYGDELFEDEQYDPQMLEYAFQLWEPATIAGTGNQVGGVALSIWGDQTTGKRPGQGGFLTKYLLPHVVEIERRDNPNAVGSQAWAWLPPHLLGEGSKVRPDWLHSYLLEPRAIRPASFMRMPKYNMSTGEATALVDYFAAVDHVDYPYDFNARRSLTYLAQAEANYQKLLDEAADPATGQERTRLNDAMRIVSDKNYCVTCHIVGDYQPTTSDRAKGPDLANVHRRLRADYVRRWVAQPTSELPYTAMQVIIPYRPDDENLGGVSQSLYRGTSVQQLDAVVDLLMNFDVYASQQDGLVAPADHTAERETDFKAPAPD